MQAHVARTRTKGSAQQYSLVTRFIAVAFRSDDGVHRRSEARIAAIRATRGGVKDA
jgi:hypothetical protein